MSEPSDTPGTDALMASMPSARFGGCWTEVHAIIKHAWELERELAAAKGAIEIWKNQSEINERNVKAIGSRAIKAESELTALRADVRPLVEAVQAEITVTQQRLDGLLSYLERNAQYWKENNATVDWLRQRVERLSTALAKHPTLAPTGKEQP